MAVISQSLFNALDLERQGRTNEAVEILRDALRSNPGNVDILRNLGRILLGAGLAEEAQQALRQAQIRSPKSAEISMHRGVALAMMGDFKKAIKNFENAIAADPSHVLAYFNLGNALQSLGRHAEAGSAFETAIQLNSNFVEAYVAKAISLLALEDHLGAAALCERAIKLRSNFAPAMYTLGIARQELGQLSDAIQLYEAAIAIAQNYADAHHGLGIALQMMGSVDKARLALTRAAELAPRSGRIQRDLVESHRIERGDPILPKLEELASQETLGVTDRIHVMAALGKVYSDLGDDRRAFEFILKANELQHSRGSYDEKSTLSLFERVKATFSTELMREKWGRGETSRVPIFIIGMPRSGSTLVEQILASHSHVFGAGEVRAFSAAINSIGFGLFESSQFLNKVHALSATEFLQIGQSYLERIRPLAPSADRVADKFLNNFMCAGLISLCLPNAKIVHVMRDPLDCCVSRFMSVFMPGSPYAYDLGELGRYHRAYELMMKHWRKVLPPGTVLDLRYEDIVSDPEPNMRRLLAHCGLEWDDACLDFHRVERIVATPTRLDVRKKMYAGSIGRWKRYREYLCALLAALNRDESGELIVD